MHSCTVRTTTTTTTTTTNYTVGDTYVISYQCTRIRVCEREHTQQHARPPVFLQHDGTVLDRRYITRGRSGRQAPCAPCIIVHAAVGIGIPSFSPLPEIYTLSGKTPEADTIIDKEPGWIGIHQWKDSRSEFSSTIWFGLKVIAKRESFYHETLTLPDIPDSTNPFWDALTPNTHEN